MKDLVLEVDVFGIPLRYDGEPPESSWPVELPEGLREEIIDWNERFGPLISASDLYSPEDHQIQCTALNEEGKLLADRIASELSNAVKVRYIPEKI
jgi:hypothetical protein